MTPDFGPTDELAELAANILEFSAPAALGEHLAPTAERDWLRAAQAYLDGSPDDLMALCADMDNWDEYRSQALSYEERHGTAYLDYDQWMDGRSQ